MWLGAAWSVGLAVTDDPALLDEADLVVCGPDGVATYAGHAARVPVVALSLRPLGGRFAEALPSGVTDYGAVVLAQPDAFAAVDPPAADDVGWRGRDGYVDPGGPARGGGRVGVVDAGRAAADRRQPVHARRAGDPARPGVRSVPASCGCATPTRTCGTRRAEQERATDQLRD